MNTVGEWIDVNAALPLPDADGGPVTVLLLFAPEETTHWSLPYTLGFLDRPANYDYWVWGDLMQGDETDREVVAWSPINTKPDFLVKAAPVSAQILATKKKIAAKREKINA